MRSEFYKLVSLELFKIHWILAPGTGKKKKNFDAQGEIEIRDFSLFTLQNDERLSS